MQQEGEEKGGWGREHADPAYMITPKIQKLMIQRRKYKVNLIEHCFLHHLIEHCYSLRLFVGTARCTWAVLARSEQSLGEPVWCPSPV